LVAPISRGSVTINSSDPFVPPIIDPNFLSHPMDVHTLKVAISNAIRFTAAKPLGDYILSPDGDFASGDDDKVEAYIRNNSGM
jgi:hypothetical protein